MVFNQYVVMFVCLSVSLLSLLAGGNQMLITHLMTKEVIYIYIFFSSNNWQLFHVAVIFTIIIINYIALWVLQSYEILTAIAVI